MATAPSSASTIQRSDPGASIFAVTGASSVAIRAGTTIGAVDFMEDTPLALPELTAGTDYAVRLVDGSPVIGNCSDGVPTDAVGGFHFAPGGNAAAAAGGDTVAAINPFSCWDAGFRPACPDPRGMALIDRHGARFWCDIYLLGVDHLTAGTSRFGQTIADGKSLPQATDGKGRTKKLDYAAAASIYAHHGKRLLTVEEFFAAAYGVSERTAADNDPDRTGLDAPRTSRFGLMQATGNMWVWGNDGHPDIPRASIFGGSWWDGGNAGSRYASLDGWAGNSLGGISARGACDHLSPA